MVSNGVEWCGVKWCQVSVTTLESLVIRCKDMYQDRSWKHYILSPLPMMRSLDNLVAVPRTSIHLSVL